MNSGNKISAWIHTIGTWIAAHKAAAGITAAAIVVAGGAMVALGAGGSPEPVDRPAVVIEENTSEEIGFLENYVPNLLRGERMAAVIQEILWEKAVADNRKAEDDRWQALYDEGLSHVADGDYDSAISCFQDAIAMAPDKSAAYLELAKVYMVMEDYELAKEILDQGLLAAGETEELRLLLTEAETQLAEAEKEEEEQEVIEIPEVVVAKVNDVEDPEPVTSEEEKGTSTEVSIEEIIEEEKNNSSYENVSRSYGIDVSKYQGSIDWAAVAASGVEFAIIRIGYRGSAGGDIYMDPYFTQNIKGALANGIKVGIYFFSTAIDEEEAKVEAAWVCKQIAAYQITYPVVYDCENYNSSSYRNYGIGKTQRSKNAAAFLNYVKSAGYTPMMYASKYAYYNDWDLSVITGCKYWLAHYTTSGLSTPSDYTGSYQMWQYSSKGTVSGISGYVDMNVAYFSYSNTPDPTVGTVTYQVKDEAGQAVEGAEVSLTGESSRTTVKAVTDANGNAVFSGVVARDTYTVKVSSCPDGYVTSSESQTNVEFMKAADSYNGSLAIKRIVCASITYTVKDDKNQPAAGVTVKLTGTSAYGKSEVSLTAVTDADGKAVFQNVLLGSYTVAVSAVPSGYGLPAAPVADELSVTSAAAVTGTKTLKVEKTAESETPESTAPGSTVPGTTAPETTEPGTTAPETTAPETTEPGTTAPETTEPGTTAPETTAPAATEPETTEPGTTAPETTAPATTEPETMAPETTALTTSAAQQSSEAEADLAGEPAGISEAAAEEAENNPAGSAE